MAVQPFVRLWPLLQFRNLFFLHRRYNSFDEWSARRNGGSMFLRNVSEPLSEYTVLHPIRQYSLKQTIFKQLISYTRIKQWYHIQGSSLTVYKWSGSSDYSSRLILHWLTHLMLCNTHNNVVSRTQTAHTCLDPFRVTALSHLTITMASRSSKKSSARWVFQTVVIYFSFPSIDLPACAVSLRRHQYNLSKNFGRSSLRTVNAICGCIYVLSSIVLNAMENVILRLLPKNQQRL
jgi:hypothetical protein